MKILNFKILGAVTLGLFLQNAAIADTITDLFNTGVDDSGLLLPDAADDPHYDITVQPTFGLTDAKVPAGFPFPFWVANTANSAWIGPNTTSADGPSGNYIYETFFTLPSNTILSTVSIAGNWAADNRDPNNGFLNQIILNGTMVFQGINEGAFGPEDGFSSFSPFAFNGSDFPTAFQVGSNTLEFQVPNTPFTGTNPTGLHVQFSEKSFNVAQAVPAPTLNSVTALTLMMLGLAGWSFSYQRRKV